MEIPQSSRNDRALSSCSCKGSLGMPSVIHIQGVSVSDLLGEQALTGRESDHCVLSTECRADRRCGVHELKWSPEADPNTPSCPNCPLSGACALDTVERLHAFRRVLGCSVNTGLEAPRPFRKKMQCLTAVTQ